MTNKEKFLNLVDNSVPPMYPKNMKTQIYELRTRIDGLAQLVKSMDRPVLMISKADTISEDTIEELDEKWRKGGNIISLPMASEIEYKGGLSFLCESYKSLLLAKAWLGKVLAELGEETPYKNDGTRKTAEDIEPTAGTANRGHKSVQEIEFEVLIFPEMTYIEKIDWLREEISNIRAMLSYTTKDSNKNELRDFCGYPLVEPVFWASSMSINYLTEARFYLGFELSRIKETI